MFSLRNSIRTWNKRLSAGYPNLNFVRSLQFICMRNGNRCDLCIFLTRQLSIFSFFHGARKDPDVTKASYLIIAAIDKRTHLEYN